MIVPGQVQQQFNLLRPYVESLTRQVRDTVLSYCESRGFAYTGRAKTAESLSEKIETGRFSRLDEIDDWFACSIVRPTLHEEDGVARFLREQFIVDEIKSRGSTWKSPDVFRFEATRVVARIRPRDGEPSALINKIRFEVQIRSAFEHAWSSATHKLVYKSESLEWRRLRLAAQLKASVEQLDQLLLSFETSAESIGESRWESVEWKQKIIEAFKALADNGVVPSEVAPKDWSRFAENVLQALQASSEWPRHRGQRGGFVDRSLESVRDHLTKLSAGDEFPRSLSLLQTVFAVLWTNGQIQSPLRHYVAPLTAEVDDVFPEIKNCRERVHVSWL